MDPTGAAINCAIVRFRLFERINGPALKSCISASEVTAIVPVSPLDDMLTGRLPGAMKAKMACIMFDSALMGPQFVSPNTRRPTSISGSDSRIAISDSHNGIPMLKYWTKQITTVITNDPMTTQRIGNSRGLSSLTILLPLRPRKDLTIRFHFNASEVRPPATINPVAGHMTQSKVRG